MEKIKNEIKSIPKLKDNCPFWIIYGKYMLFYCGLDPDHEGDHQIAIPRKFKEDD